MLGKIKQQEKDTEYQGGSKRKNERRKEGKKASKQVKDNMKNGKELMGEVSFDLNIDREIRFQSLKIKEEELPNWGEVRNNNPKIPPGF